MTVDQTIKQRLVGAIVLVAVAVIFLPGILGKKTERKTFSSKISESSLGTDKSSSSQPATEKNSIDLQLGAGQSTSDSNKDQSATKDETTKSSPQTGKEVQQLATSTQKPPSSSNDKSKPKSGSGKPASVATKPGSKVTKSKPGASKATDKAAAQFKKPSWLIQVGSFSSNANARSLAKKLEEQKMKAFVRPVNLKQGEVLYRVFVGPWFEKRQAEAKVAQVTEITRLKPIVVPWQPNLH